IPFVDDNDHCTSFVMGKACDAFILFENAFLPIDDHQYDIGAFYGPVRPENRILLSRLIHFALFSHACGINQGIVFPVIRICGIDRIPGRAAISEAITLSSPSMALIRLDLPTFGRPISDTLMGASISSSISSVLK